MGGGEHPRSARYLEINRENWDARVAAHVASATYEVDRFRSDPSFLSAVVRFDLPLLGDVRGAAGVHLQCHIGTDTVSLARLGASMTGLDFSRPAVEAARALAAATGDDATFVHAELDRAVEVLGPGRFDVVYTGIGALCWLPRVDDWASVVAALLAPGGRLFVREAHPMLWAMDDERADLVVARFPYFEQPEPLVYDSALTYVQTEEVFASTTAAVWNHGLGETVTALLRRGLAITGLAEHDSVPWNALPGQMECGAGGEWRLREDPSRLAHSFTLQAVKP